VTFNIYYKLIDGYNNKYPNAISFCATLIFVKAYNRVTWGNITIQISQ